MHSAFFRGFVDHSPESLAETENAGTCHACPPLLRWIKSITASELPVLKITCAGFRKFPVPMCRGYYYCEASSFFDHSKRETQSKIEGIGCHLPTACDIFCLLQQPSSVQPRTGSQMALACGKLISDLRKGTFRITFLPSCVEDYLLILGLSFSEKYKSQNGQ